uniref:Uncharacterized protein n=1 Tax=Romanomermis culicivorax TaxID=13658 RepID=A0A915KZJ8_ROMCU
METSVVEQTSFSASPTPVVVAKNLVVVSEQRAIEDESNLAESAPESEADNEKSKNEANDKFLSKSVETVDIENSHRNFSKALINSVKARPIADVSKTWDDELDRCKLLSSVLFRNNGNVDHGNQVDNDNDQQSGVSETYYQSPNFWRGSSGGSSNVLKLGSGLVVTGLLRNLAPSPGTRPCFFRHLIPNIYFLFSQEKTENRTNSASATLSTTNSLSIPPGLLLPTSVNDLSSSSSSSVATFQQNLHNYLIQNGLYQEHHQIDPKVGVSVKPDSILNGQHMEYPHNENDSNEQQQRQGPQTVVVMTSSDGMQHHHTLQTQQQMHESVVLHLQQQVQQQQQHSQHVEVIKTAGHVAPLNHSATDPNSLQQKCEMDLQNASMLQITDLVGHIVGNCSFESQMKSLLPLLSKCELLLVTFLNFGEHDLPRRMCILKLQFDTDNHTYLAKDE